MPEIEVKRMWSSWNVRSACIANDLYTNGDNYEYARMLKMVDQLEPTYENLYVIAKDIAEHSIPQTISNVMFILENKAVYTCFTVDGEE